MNLLKITLLCTVAALSSRAFSQSIDAQILMKSLKPWQPVGIEVKTDSVKIKLPTATVTSDAYEALISSGVCTPVWVKSALRDISKTPKRYMSLINFQRRAIRLKPL